MYWIVRIFNVESDVHWRYPAACSDKAESAMQPNLPHANAAKKATNVSMAEALLAEAKALRINISQAAEAGLARAVAEKRAELWLQENRAALESSNAYVEKHGLPLEKHRTF
jgi:antitoxin CcdA